MPHLCYDRPMHTNIHPQPARRRARWAVGLLCLVLLALAGPVAQAQTPPSDAPVPTVPAEAIPPDQDMVQETLEARVVSATPPQPCVPEPSEVTGPGVPPNQCQQIELLITAGSLAGQRIVVEEG